MGRHELRPRIVCLCGSTRHEAEFAEATRHATAAGMIVLAPGCDLRTSHPLWDTDTKREKLKPQLDALHRAKIDLADEILVVTDATGYIGASTRDEIAYAHECGKSVRWWNPEARLQRTAIGHEVADD